MKIFYKKNIKGFTLLEILIATLLMSIVFMGVSSLYLASRKLYLASSNRVIISNELQYAAQHIYKYAMRGMGDKNTPSFQITGGDRLDININNNDPLTAANYSDVTTYSYYKSGNTLMFNNGTPLDLTDDESLIPKVTVTAVSFTESTNVLTGYITAYYNDSTKPLTFYFSCYPRPTSFN